MDTRTTQSHLVDEKSRLAFHLWLQAVDVWPTDEGYATFREFVRCLKRANDVAEME